MFGAVQVHRRATVQARTGGPHPHRAGAGELSGDHALGTALRAGDPAGALELANSALRRNWSHHQARHLQAATGEPTDARWHLAHLKARFLP